MGEPGGATPRLDALTGLRWWAAFAVFLAHVVYLGDLPVLGGVYWIGWSGVAFFFLLSGFVLSWSARPDDSARSFYRRRFARIYPAYAVSVLLALPVFYGDQGWWFQRTPLQVLPLLLALLLLQGWFPWIGSVFFAGNPGGWSLSDEAFFYSVFPALRRRGRSSRAWLVVTGLLLAVAGIPAALALLLPPLSDAEAFAARSPLSTLPLFLAGVALAQAMRAGWRPRFSVVGASAMLTLSLVSVWLLAWLGNLVPTEQMAVLFAGSAPGFAAVIASVAHADLDGRSRILTARGQVVLGDWSYAFYLIHPVVVYGAVILRQRGDVALPVPILDPLVLLLSIVAAAALHQAVERPAERRLRREVVVDLRGDPHTKGTQRQVQQDRQ